MPKKLSLSWQADSYTSSDGYTITRSGVVDGNGELVKSLKNEDADRIVAEAARYGVFVVEADDPAAVDMPAADAVTVAPQDATTVAPVVPATGTVAV